MDRKQLCALSIAVLALILCQPVIFAQERIASNEVAANVVEIRNVVVNKDAISGEIVNKSPYPLRNVELLLQYHWLWANETKPGAISLRKRNSSALAWTARARAAATACDEAWAASV